MKHKRTHILLRRLLILSTLVGFVVLSSCNAKEEDVIGDSNITTESVAITDFSLTADLRVMKNLDSVFFSIDLEHGVVFNADSLPKGTNVTKLIPKIKYPSSVKTATIEMTGGTHRTGTVNYHSNSSDTIDFTGKVTLTLATANDAISKTYTLKVNVHKEDPDTIYWDKLAVNTLPSRLENPLAQKTVAYGKGTLALIEENDGTYTLSTADDIFAGSFIKEEVTPGFTPAIETLTASTEGDLYLLGDDGRLMTSTDGKSWAQATSGWQNIIGFYGDTLLGISGDGTSTVMKSYPEGAFPEMALPADFPLTGFTSPIEFTNRWTPDPTIIIFGGYPFPTNGRSASWAFDGTEWVNIAENSMPALSGLSVMSYYSYLNSAVNGILKEFEVYLAFGGRDADGNNNETIYVSYDHGINWQRAQSYMQLPKEVTAGYMVDALSIDTLLESNLSNQWKSVATKRRLPFEVEGEIIKWNCPYIFLFGGYDAKGILNPRIRSGVLQRLTFQPLF